MNATVGLSGLVAHRRVRKGTYSYRVVYFIYFLLALTSQFNSLDRHLGQPSGTRNQAQNPVQPETRVVDALSCWIMSVRCKTVEESPLTCRPPSS
jgi:hypothetical protein